MFTNQPKKKKQLSIMVFPFQKYILEFHRCTCIYIYIVIQTSQRFTTFDSSKLMMEDGFFSSRGNLYQGTRECNRLGWLVFKE